MYESITQFSTHSGGYLEELREREIVGTGSCQQTFTQRERGKEH